MHDQSTANRPAVPEATSILLHGDPQTATQTVFFFPDGCGAAFSYLHLPLISGTTVSYGLNSPFLDCGDLMSMYSLDEVVESYVEEIRCQQPLGPYRFAGWSAGGVLAFRTAQILIAAGEVVREMALIDCLAPGDFGILPERFLKLCESTGVFGVQGALPPWLLSHFRGSNHLLANYGPTPLEHAPGLRKVSILWATTTAFPDGVFERSPKDPPVLRFLTRERTNFGAGAWADLLPETPIMTRRAEKEHHFSMMREHNADNVGAFLARAFEAS